MSDLQLAIETTVRIVVGLTVVIAIVRFLFEFGCYGRVRRENALDIGLGLMLVFGAVLVLNVISPSLLKFGFTGLL